MIYPDNAGQAGGTVVLRFTIGADGHVQAPEIVRSTPAGVFDQAALQSVARFLYHPRLHDGRPVPQPGHVVNLTFEPRPAEVLQPVSTGRLSYPRAAYDARQEGSVSVAYDVSVYGRPVNVRVLRVSPPLIFDQAAMAHVRSWEFDRPKSGQPVIGQVSEVVFRLRDADPAPVPDRPIRISYPPAAQARGVMGECNVQYWIEEDGTTSGARIRNCFPAGFFEEATLDAVRRATYKPEADPRLNKRRLHDTDVVFRFYNTNEREVHYLQPGQWIKFRYTLSRQGRAQDVEVIGKSDQSLNASIALLQLKQTAFSPVLENGLPIEKPGLTIAIIGH